MKILMLLSCQGLYLNDYIKYKLKDHIVDIISMRSMDYKFPYHFINYNIQYDIIIIQGFDIIRSYRFCKLLQHNLKSKIIIFTFSKKYDNYIYKKYINKYNLLYLDFYSKYIDDWKKNHICDYMHLNLKYITKIFDDLIDYVIKNNQQFTRNFKYQGDILYRTQKNSDIINKINLENYTLIDSLYFIKNKKTKYKLSQEINFYKKINTQLPLQFNQLYFCEKNKEKKIHLELKNNINYCSILIPSIYCETIVNCIDKNNIFINNNIYNKIEKDLNWGNISTTTVRCYDIFFNNIKTIDINIDSKKEFGFYFFMF